MAIFKGKKFIMAWPRFEPGTRLATAGDHLSYYATGHAILDTALISMYIKPRANRRNIVGQQLPTLLDVTCCVPLHTLLHVVGCCCVLLRKVWTGQTFQPTTPNISFVMWSPKRSATMLDPFARFFQHCRGHARSLRMDCKDLRVVFFPRCTAGPKLVGGCCIRLHTTANTHATTPNIVSATMLGVVAPVCTQPNIILNPKKKLTVSSQCLTLINIVRIPNE